MDTLVFVLIIIGMTIVILSTLYGTKKFFLPLLANNPERADIHFGLPLASGRRRRSSRRHHRKRSSRRHH